MAKQGKRRRYRVHNATLEEQKAPRARSDAADPTLRGEALPDKASMEEALHVICFECGRGAGRHSVHCSRSR